jgi:hypothetical protein
VSGRLIVGVGDALVHEPGGQSGLFAGDYDDCDWQPVIQNTLYVLSAPIEPSAWTVSLIESRGVKSPPGDYRCCCRGPLGWTRHLPATCHHPQPVRLRRSGHSCRALGARDPYRAAVYGGEVSHILALGAACRERHLCSDWAAVAAELQTLLVQVGDDAGNRIGEIGVQMAKDHPAGLGRPW